MCGVGADALSAELSEKLHSDGSILAKSGSSTAMLDIPFSGIGRPPVKLLLWLPVMLILPFQLFAALEPLLLELSSRQLVRWCFGELCDVADTLLSAFSGGKSTRKSLLMPRMAGGCCAILSCCSVCGARSPARSPHQFKMFLNRIVCAAMALEHLHEPLARAWERQLLFRYSTTWTLPTVRMLRLTHHQHAP